MFGLFCLTLTKIQAHANPTAVLIPLWALTVLKPVMH